MHTTLRLSVSLTPRWCVAIADARSVCVRVYKQIPPLVRARNAQILLKAQNES